MTKMEIILLVIGVAFLALACYAVPLLIQIKKTAAKAEETLCSINQSLPAVMKNLEEITARTNRVAGAVERQTEDIVLTVEKINSSMNFYLDREKVFREQVALPFANAFWKYGAVIKGVRAFWDSLKNT
jgi:uncharacterized protein YoxC